MFSDYLNCVDTEMPDYYYYSIRNTTRRDVLRETQRSRAEN
jgi:hypothetical protein